MNMNLGRAFYFAREYDKAVEHFAGMLAKDPSDVRAQYMLGLVYQQKGMLKEAVEIFQKIYSTNKLMGAAPLGYAYGKDGRREEALKILDEMKELAAVRHLPPQEMAIIYIGLDERDEAFRWLERAYEERFASLIYLTAEPMFDGLRSDARFADLAQRLKLPPPRPQ